MVKNILAGFGVVFIIVLLGVGGLYIKWKLLNSGATQYATDSVSAIFTNWDYEELKRRADPRMYETTPEEGIQNGFKTFTKLGKLQELNGCKGQTTLNLDKNNPNVTGQYACSVKFENDNTNVVLFLTRPDGDWRIGGIHVDSDYLLKTVKQQQPAPAKQ